nr:MAG TPA: hypothetical protein [Caudoviricetes sp.]
MGTKDRNRMANSFNFIHFYRKNKKEMSYAIRCTFNGIDYAIRIGSVANKSGTSVSDTMLNRTSTFAYMQTRDIDWSNNFLRSILVGINTVPIDNLYTIDNYMIVANAGADSHAVVNDIHSIHFVYIGQKIYGIGRALLKPKILDNSESGRNNDFQRSAYIRSLLMHKARTKELKSFCIKLKNPIYLRRSTFREKRYIGD